MTSQNRPSEPDEAQEAFTRALDILEAEPGLRSIRAELDLRSGEWRVRGRTVVLPQPRVYEKRPTA